ncbi:hypothetical protein L596_002398 [Steinernema carpocapsae]|uniref:Uncharacterized protein n=1 Tax=Steinernema carpocapsae TaxID=34508 RepID=A0A4U8UQ59_STECR|nr:hypothetical protein L596_002398 [Steinernema carpocapsae]
MWISSPSGASSFRARTDEQIAMDYVDVFNEPEGMEAFSDLGDLRLSPKRSPVLLDDSAFDKLDESMADLNFLGDADDPFLCLKKPIKDLSVKELVRRIRNSGKVP